MFKNNWNLLVISLIAVVNALGYGIVIPILYSYTQRFGLTDFQNGLLFALYSVCQFISTPVIGMLSDKFGRKPLLLISLVGTVISFLILAWAPGAFFIFLARALDGLTAGNLPVAQAVIVDTTRIRDRVKGFSILGAAFGFGFAVGPAISALTVGIYPSLPFLIAAGVSLVAVIATAIFLPETNRHQGKVRQSAIDFRKLYQALFYPMIGTTLLITLFYFLALSSFLFSFQPFLVKVLHMSANKISLLFTLFGTIGLLTQTLFVNRISQKLGLHRAFSTAIAAVCLSFILSFMAHSIATFVISMVIFGFANSIVQPLINTILSEETDNASQGTILGLNTSYMSIGQILGPIFGGVAATISIPYAFYVGAVVAILCLYLSLGIHTQKVTHAMIQP